MPGAGIYRAYEPFETSAVTGYPFAWDQIKCEVREAAGFRCIRCGHPYRNGEHGTGEWSPCDAGCDHPGPLRWWSDDETWHTDEVWILPAKRFRRPDLLIQARWRILTVHHLDGDKMNCRWWNLVSLCQRCHLTIQARVKMERAFIFEHSAWFKPYAAGWYAYKYLDEDITRAEADERREELLALERLA